MGEAVITAAYRSPIPGPYPGLRAFRESEAAIFFGRDEQIDGLMERLEHERLVVIAGESGCGKSSLVRAGLLPALEAGFLRGGGTQWRVADLRPGNRPIFHLAQALVGVLRPGQGDDAAFLAARLRCGPRGICDLLNDFPLPSGAEILILVDQFEELIRFRARIDPDEADAFVALLLETVADKSVPVRVVLTLRSDYLGGCTIFPGLPEALNGSQYLVPRLGRDELRETIINPARVFDGDVDSQLANQLINEIGQSQDQLPVLEHALLAMWNQPFNRRRATDLGADHGGTPRPTHLKLDDYRSLGGLGEALSRHADVVFNSLKEDDKKQIARRLFCALWDDGATGRDTRRPCSVREAAEIAGVKIDQLKEVVEAFRKAEHSFLMPPPDVPLTEDTVLDVSHESLFRHWTRLKEWIRDEAEGAEHYQRLLGLARAHRQKKGDLLSSRTLQLAIGWWDSQQPNVAWARKYSDRSEDFALVARFLRDSWRARRRRRWLVWGFLITVVVVGYGVTFGKYRFSEEKQTGLLRQQVYSAAAFNAQRSEPVRALQLALEAQSDVDNPQADAALHSALRGAHFRSILFPSLGSFQNAKFLPPDGSRIITAGEADGLAIWDVATGRRLYALHGAIPATLAVDSKGARAATASDDGTVDVWDLSMRKHLWTQRHQASPITDIAFSPDGSLLATASEAGSAVLWSVQDGEAKHRLIDHLGAVTGLAFSHDGNRIATAGADGRIVLWDTHSGHKLELFTQLPDVTKLAFDATGRFLAATSGNSLMLWDPVTQRMEEPLRHTSKVTAIAFSPDGRRFATTGLDGTLRVWDASSRTERFWTSSDVPLHDYGRSAGELSVSYGGEASWLRTVQFSTDGRKLVTTGADGSAKVWDVEAGGESLTFRAHEQAIRRIAVSPNGDQIATGSDDGTAAVWDADGHRVFGVPASRAVLALAYDATGTHLAVSDGKKVNVWTREGNRVGSLEADDRVGDLQWYHGQDRIAVAAGPHVEIWSISDFRRMTVLDAKTPVQAVSISPEDDRYIASECRDPEDADESAHHICLWDAHSFHKIAVLEPHAHGTRGDGQPQGVKEAGRGRAILSLCFSRDGSWLASSDDKTIKIWEIGGLGGHLRATLVGHREGIAGLAISPDGRLLVSSGADRIRLWNATSYLPQDGFPDAEFSSSSVAFYRDGRRFVAGGNDGVVRVYRIDSTSLQALAEDRVPVPLPDSECKRNTNTDCHSRATSLQLTNEIRYLLHRGPPTTWGQSIAMAVRIDPWQFGVESTRFANARNIREAVDAASIVLQRVSNNASHAPASVHGKASEEFAELLASASHTGQIRSEALLEQVQRDATVLLDATELTSRIETLLLTGLARNYAEDGKPALAIKALELVPVSHDGGRWAEHAVTDIANAAVMRVVRDQLTREEYKAAAEKVRALSISTEEHSDRTVVLQRFVATTLASSGNYPGAIKATASLAFREGGDVELLAEHADILRYAGYPDRALAMLARGLNIDPTNDRMLWLQAQVQSQLGLFDDAAATLRKISPLAPFYMDAAAMAGVISYAKLARLTEGFRSMVLTVDPQDASSWAKLAQAAWATGRLREAWLIAGRVLEARAVKQSSPDVELAMHFVRVAALCQSQDWDHAEAELGALLATAPLVTTRTWSYEGNRASLGHIKEPKIQQFVRELLAYSESRGQTGTPQQLIQLLHEARDAPPVPTH
ncbi:MAG TPA: AAA family ATPase [Kofleriaceae bacterium]